MKQLMLICAYFFLSFMAQAQSETYKGLIKLIEEEGWTFYTDKLVYLKEGESSSAYFTLPGNREYQIVYVADNFSVTDVDGWAYSDAGELLGKDVEEDAIAIIPLEMPVQARVKLTIKNEEADRPNDALALRILVTYRARSYLTVVPKSTLSASELYEKGEDYYFGRGVTKDYATAVKWYRQAADLGYEKAMADLGHMYSNGKGVAVNYGEAMRWYKLAAEKGNASAMNSIGFMYGRGQGVEKDYWEALKWYHKAADKGNAAAMYNIGIYYKNGNGVSQNYEEARRWFKKSAEKGDEDAINMLKTF